MSGFRFTKGVQEMVIKWLFKCVCEYLCICNSAILYFVAGKGAMAEVSTIVSVVKQYLQKPDE